MVWWILSLDPAKARIGPTEGPKRANNDALAEESAASTTDPAGLLRPIPLDCYD